MPSPPANGGAPAVGSPPAGSSTLITSAPSPASSSVQYGPDRKRVKSSTRSPSSAPLMRPTAAQAQQAS
jgi:hypothetical protein